MPGLTGHAACNLSPMRPQGPADSVRATHIPSAMFKTLHARALSAIALAYGFGLSAAILAQFTAWAHNAWVEALANTMPLPLLPALALAPVSLVFRRWVLAVSLCIPCLYGAGAYTPLLLAKPAAALANAGSITVLSYNLYARDRDFEPVFALIRDADADVIAFQELGDAAAEAFEREFARDYPYQAFHPEQDSNIRGQGLMSRLPLLADTYWRIGLGQQRVVVDASKRPGGRATALYNMHLNMPFEFKRLPPFDARKRDAVVDDLLMRLRDERIPTIVTGDFNMNDRSYQYPRITALVADSWRTAGAGMGASWPAVFDDAFNHREFPQRLLPAPVMRIDYVFHSVGLRPLDARVWPTSAGSDHRPLRVTLAYEPKNRR